MTLFIFYLCMAAVALAIGLFIGKRSPKGGSMAWLENDFVAYAVAVVISTSFMGGFIGTIAMPNYIDLPFMELTVPRAMGIFVVVQAAVAALVILLVPNNQAEA